MEEPEALAVHNRVVLLHGGAPGIRERERLAAALARPQQRHAYDATADMPALAASYTAGIMQNHPFMDGNKRTGFVLGILFLELNGSRFHAKEADAAQAVIELASGLLDETGYAAFLRANSRRLTRR